MAETRTDKFLWAVRLFKTRTLSSEACKKGRVRVDGIPVKPSRTVKIGEFFTINKPPVNYRYKVIGIPHNRLSAKLVPEYIQDLTPDEELKKLEMNDSFFVNRDRGSGRPTKKERRDIEKLKDT